MKSLACNTRDECIPTEKNRHPDMFIIDFKIENGFSKSHVDVPFVNSLSGHTLIFIAVLERFLIKYKNDTERRYCFNKYYFKIIPPGVRTKIFNFIK